LHSYTFIHIRSHYRRSAVSHPSLDALKPRIHGCCSRRRCRA